MIKSLVRCLLSKTGYQLTKVPEKDPVQRSTTKEEENRFLYGISNDPLNARLHSQYALDVSKKGNTFLAYAEHKTAEYLGEDQRQIDKHKVPFRIDVPELKYMNHNQYFRFKSLADEIISRASKASISILDVGGGQGQLATFLPDNFTYCLAEPEVNGISGTSLPFPDNSFDYVVSCHVLEHIPENERSVFLDQLLSKSRQGVILLNPFHVEGSNVRDRLKLVIEITGAQWAKEHLNCSLPTVNEIQAYATERELQFCAKPNGTLTTSMAFVFMDYFYGDTKGHSDDWKKINAFFNQKFADILDSDNHPTAYLIYLGRHEIS